MNDILKNNLHLLREKHPHAARIVEDYHPADSPAVEVFSARSGAPSARVIPPGGRPHALHSAYDPVKEARRFASASGVSAGDAALVLGFGLGHHIRALQEAVGPDGYVAVIEADIAVFRAALQHVDVRDIFSADNFSLFLDCDPCEQTDLLKSIATDLVARRFVFCEHEPSVRLNDDAYRLVRTWAKNIIHSAHSEMVTLCDNAPAFFENTWSNLPTAAGSGGVKDIFGKFAGVPAVNIAAGPSLDRNIPALKTAGNKALLIAVDTALKPLLENDIVPHIVVAVDPSPMNARYFECVRGRAMKDCILVCSMSVSPPVLEHFDGTAYFIDEDNRLCRFLRPYMGERGTMNTGLSVAHTAFYLAREMGCDPIVLVAQDLSFAGGRTHAAGTERTWGGTVDTNDPNIVWLEGNDGDLVASLPMFRSFLATFEREIAATQARVINATEGGALIRGTERGRLDELLNTFNSDVGETLFAIPKSGRAADLAGLHERCEKLSRDAQLTAESAKAAAERIERALALHSGASDRASVIGKANKALSRILEHGQVLELLEDVMIEARLAIRYKKGGGGVDAEIARALQFARSAREAAALLIKCITRFRKLHAGVKQ